MHEDMQMYMQQQDWQLQAKLLTQLSLRQKAGGDYRKKLSFLVSQFINCITCAIFRKRYITSKERQILDDFTQFSNIKTNENSIILTDTEK